MGKVRTRGRELAFQILFQCDQTGDKVNLVISRFLDMKQANKDAAEFAEALAVGAFKQQDKLDELIRAEAQNWKLERLLSVDRAVLRLGAYELVSTPETPVEVVLDEAIEIAKNYGSDESAAFVNGVLDQVAAKARKVDRPKPVQKPKAPSPGQNKPKIVGRIRPVVKSTPIPKKKKAA